MSCVSSDPPEQPADADEPIAPESAVPGSGVTEPPAEPDDGGEPDDAKPDDVKPDGAEPDEADRSYEERVLDRLVPEVNAGNEADEATAEQAVEPEPEADSETDFSEALEEIDDDLLNAFVGIVVSIKAGILLVSVGLLLVGFQDMLTVGGGLIAVGGLAFARAAKRYWTHGQAEPTDEEPDGPAETDESGRNG